ncbi:MAG: VCBS repeat-containing protein, partial [Bacteroidia bacterium]|nr:VCBS repeat-containing protein [Bacteroidia bacterium]
MIKLRFLITAKKKALLILMIFISYSLKSQVTFTDSISLIPGTFKSVIPVGVLDMNNDGFDDIIHFRDRYTFVLSYYNKGNDFDTTNLGKMDSINVWSYPWSICVGDYDTDGDNDILFGGGLISLLLKNNSANGNFTTEVLPDTFFAQGSNFVDINNDGLLDIFICNDTAGNIIYKNSGEYFYKTNSLINTGDVAGNYASIWTDYDNDKDLDLYISKCYHDADSSGDLRRINVLYQNDGNGNFYESAKIAGINDSSQSWCADFGDIDNDG